jgi:hypothetical protein
MQNFIKTVGGKRLLYVMALDTARAGKVDAGFPSARAAKRKLGR